MIDPLLSWEVHDDVPRDAADVVDSGLGQSNEAAAPLDQVQRLASCARRDGKVLGGAVGRTWGECCELQQLWVDPAWRGRGIGAQLIRLFEERAQMRGCRKFYLETFSFQAPNLYRSLGYEVGLELHGFPDGIVKYVMVRQTR
jgi:ribosomal protein S18 acetylase RimI-like enzyme